ncbi:Clp1-domain-containing protein [Lepidopterella palustris CBS 459.81]|uniref:Polynucleotide 5'-hydroxyl-kinase GRC3 n=1 Tax=Lepidopterella palustris CBS 459.81 TaxID=1314670 RepID=A0A8E2EG68_9PEZI|nr:Clp1-domain-containing protein [Lepidopterella palustris CBS 459.81]
MNALPGLSLSAPQEAIPQAPVFRTQHLPAGSEYRFEVPFSQTLRIKLLSGTAELFGTELAPHSKDPYSFSGTKGAIYTWHGCVLELSGETESEYIAEETQMMSYANAHFALENVREKAKRIGQIGPRILVVGPENAGKTSVVKILTAYAIKAGRQPVVVNLDPRQGMLSLPGSFTATTFSSVVDVEEGWGSSPISGPSATPVKMPLVYHYGLASPEEGKLFKPLVTRMALAVTSRLEEDPEAKSSGCIIDTPGAISHGKGGMYENIHHIISEFSVNVLLVLGSERLYSDMSRKFSNRPSEEPVSVIKLDKSGGCVDRDESYMKQLRQSQIRAYFFGHGANTLSPHTHWEDYGSVTIFKIAEGSSKTNASFLPGDDDDVFPSATVPIYEKLTPSPMIQNCLLAVTNASPNDKQEAIRDSSIMGYLYVTDVEESKHKLKLLAPLSGRIPPNAMVMGSFPEDVAGLVGG